MIVRIEQVEKRIWLIKFKIKKTVNTLQQLK